MNAVLLKLISSPNLSTAPPPRARAVSRRARGEDAPRPVLPPATLGASGLRGRSLPRSFGRHLPLSPRERRRRRLQPEARRGDPPRRTRVPQLDDFGWTVHAEACSSLIPRPPRDHRPRARDPGPRGAPARIGLGKNVDDG